MANIIEKEIAKRQDVIDSKVEMEAKIEDLKAEINMLVVKVEEIDVEVLEAEINELKTYLEEDVVASSVNAEG